MEEEEEHVTGGVLERRRGITGRKCREKEGDREEEMSMTTRGENDRPGEGDDILKKFLSFRVRAVSQL
jgi:hypothetical protein